MCGLKISRQNKESVTLMLAHFFDPPPTSAISHTHTMRQKQPCKLKMTTWISFTSKRWQIFLLLVILLISNSAPVQSRLRQGCYHVTAAKFFAVISQTCWFYCKAKGKGGSYGQPSPNTYSVHSGTTVYCSATFTSPSALCSGHVETCRLLLQSN